MAIQTSTQQHWGLLDDHGYLWRLFGLFCFGIACAGALTWFMHFLIESTEHELDKSPRTHLLDFVRVKRDERSDSKTLRPDKPMQQEAPPAPDVPDQSQQDTAQQSHGLAVSSFDIGNGFDVDAGGYGIAMNDGEYLPIVKIAPVYPMKAQSRGLEGTCLVRYTVTTKGTVKDVSVVEDRCDNPIFHSVSIEAALKFRYKPRVVDGEAIEVPNVLNRFIFELSKD